MAREATAAAIGACFVTLAAILSFGMMRGRDGSDLLFYACAALQAALSVAAASFAVRSPNRATLPVLLGGAVLLRLWFVGQAPTLSGDVYRYVWDGRVVNAGFNPYLHVPADPALAALRDPAQYGLIDKRDYAVTIYPPVAEALFALVTRFSSSLVAMKGAMVACEVVTVAAVWHLLCRLGRSPAWVVAYLLHPAPLWEFAGNGHVDAAMMALLYAGFAWSDAARPYLASIPVTLAALVKPTALLGLPSLWRPWQFALPLFVLVLAALCYVPFIGAGTGVLGFLPDYAHEQGLDNGSGFFALAMLQRLGLFQPAMTRPYVVLSATLLIVLALVARWRGSRELRPRLAGTCVLLFAFLFLASPTFPWYAVVALPMADLLGLWCPFVLVTAGFLLYAFQVDTPSFFERWALMMALATAAAIYDVRRLRRQETVP